MAPPAVLSLFAGIGGIDLGLKRAGFRTASYVENDPYAVRVLQARMDGGDLDEAPVWDDVRTFDGKEWRDEIDLIAGGFPCQDLSFAGKRAGINGSRSGLWAEMFRAVCEVRPRLVLVENVPGILVGGLGRVLGDLASAGYDAVWTVLSAADVGAPHLRKRVFIVAHAHGDGCDGQGLPSFPWEEGALPAGGGEGEDEGMRWLTPRASEGEKNPTKNALSAQVRWPTPKTGSNRNSRQAIVDAKGGGKHKSDLSLEQAVEVGLGVLPKELCSPEELPPQYRRQFWPTPGAGDAQKARLNPAMARRVQLRLDGVVPTAPSGANYQESLPERVALEEAKSMLCYGDYRDRLPNESPDDYWGRQARYEEAHPEAVLGKITRWPTARTRGLLGGSGSREMVRAAVVRGELAQEEAEAMLGVALWPTASASPETMNRNARPLNETVTGGQGGQLNPAWVEWLVGVPVGWTDLECASPEYPEGLSFGDAWAFDPHPTVPRVAKGIPKRAQRLRCLGNAVVPQCAEQIGKRIMEAWE